MKKILFVTAHPHYAMCYCAGTITNHVAQGDEVSVLSLTQGELMTDRYTVDELRQINADEAQQAADLLGVKNLRILNIGDTNIKNDDTTRLAISDAIREWKPDILITHWPDDTHPDFRETGKTTLDAAFFAILVQGVWAEKFPQHMVKEMYGFELPMLSLNFKGSHFIDISNVVDIKKKSMECFKAHILANCGDDPEVWTSSALGPNRRWGMESGCMYAEPFEQIDVHEIHRRAQQTL